MKSTNYGKLLFTLLIAWFTFSLVGSSLHLFATRPDQPPLPILLAVLTPVALFYLWYKSSREFRDFALSLNLQALTFAQSWRVAGFVFLVLYSYGILPGSFALPAGWGDIAIGVTAPFVALRLAKPGHKFGFILWQVLGILDLVVAVGSGAASRLLAPQAVPTSPMTVLPLSLIPTFAVPLMMILHVISIAQAKRMSSQTYSEVVTRTSLGTI
jgi:hypothetical protein